jgi:hypothetical protein
MTRLLRRPRYADVVGTLALIVAMSGTAYAAHALPKNSVGTKQLKTNAVTTKDVKDAGITGADLAAGSVGSGQLAPASVTGVHLAHDAVTGATVAGDSLSLADLVGADNSGPISFALGSNSCGVLAINAPGAQLGQVPLLSAVGDDALPSSVVFGMAKVSAADTVSVRACNLSASSVTVSNLGVRIVTFG